MTDRVVWFDLPVADLDRATKMIAAIAFQRTQKVAGEAFRMQPRQHRARRRQRWGALSPDDDRIMLRAAIARPVGPALE